MALPEGMREQEKIRIENAWEGFYEDTLGRMKSKVDEDFLGWNEQVYEGNMERKLMVKTLKVASGDAEYKDFVDIANYAMMLGNFQKQREEFLYGKEHHF